MKARLGWGWMASSVADTVSMTRAYCPTSNAEPEAPWSARNGLALAIALQGRSAESVPAFESALVAAVKSAIPKQVGSAQYNLACAYAEVARFSDAAKTLKRAIEIDAQYEAKARTDNSFRRALGQPQFKWLSE